MHRLILLLTAVAVLAVPGALAKGSFPATIALPNAFQPEGIAVGTGSTFYVGSIPTGAIYSGDLRTGKGETIIAGIPGPTGRRATGLEYHRGLLWVSGAGNGKVYVYDVGSRSLVREYALATAPTFINDVVVTNRAAYFTDSQKALLYKIELSANGRPGAATTIPLSGDYQHVAGQFNLNGIDATPSGRWLLGVQSVTGRLFRIDPNTGETTLVDLGGTVLTNGDGILLHGRTLYVVQNQLNKIAVLRLSNDLTSGQLLREITDTDFQVPTTIARFGKWLYAVNARFGTPVTPDTTYHVVQVRR